jgi:hypothetical protein
MFFSRPIHLNGSLCPSLLEHGVLMPDSEVWLGTFSNVPDLKEEGYGRKRKLPMPPELAGILDYGRKRKKAADGSAKAGACSRSVMIVRRSKHGAAIQARSDGDAAVGESTTGCKTRDSFR